MRKKSVVFSLLGLLVLPWLMQFQHVLAAHEHPTCEISDHHLHDVDKSCDYPDYTLSPTFTFGASNYIVAQLPTVVKQVFSYNAPTLTSIYASGNSQRGPPSLV